MKIIKPSVEIITPVDDSDILCHIERCGRVCYKSEDKITEGSAEKFVSGLIKRGHEAVLEHGSFIFWPDQYTWVDMHRLINVLSIRAGFKCYLRITDDGTKAVVSGNVRAWRDFTKAVTEFQGTLPLYLNSLVRDNPVLFPEYQEYIQATDYIGLHPLKKTDLQAGIGRQAHYDITCIFTCDRGVSHEIVRHRDAGYCQESTRYCNYADGKFGGEITVIEPCYLKPGTYNYMEWQRACEVTEAYYLDMLKDGLSPQEARAVLPNSLKTELVMTANIREWRHFLKLRNGKGAHPQMREVAGMQLVEFQKNFPDDFDGIEVS